MGIRLKSGAIPVAVKGLPKPAEKNRETCDKLQSSPLFFIQREGIEVNLKPEDLPVA